MKCCSGSSYTCFQYEGVDPSSNLTSKCYCDEYCLSRNDCCAGYENDCKDIFPSKPFSFEKNKTYFVHHWGTWSECSVRCGEGSKYRYREVYELPFHSSSTTPSSGADIKRASYINERASCYGVNCQLEGNERNTPPEWGTWSACSAKCGVGTKSRQKSQYGFSNSNLSVTYKVRASRQGSYFYQLASCYGTDCKDRKRKYPGKIIPLKYAKYRYHKMYDPLKSIRKNIWNEPKIKRKTYCAYYSIVHAKQGCLTDVRGKEWAKNLSRGKTVCVECKRKINSNKHCVGEGAYNKKTYFMSASLHHCSGQWIMLKKRRVCKCDVNKDNSFVFV